MHIKTRIVVRNLPSNLEEKDFSALIEPFKPHIHHWYYVQKRSTKPVNSRAYIDFKDTEKLYECVSKLEKHSFLDRRGLTVFPKIEYAPYQQQLKQCKPNTRDGTIDNDPDFLKFVEQLNNPVIEEKKEEEKAPEQPESTPLLDSIRNEYAKRKQAKKPVRKNKRQIQHKMRPNKPHKDEQNNFNKKNNKNEKKKTVKWVKSE